MGASQNHAARPTRPTAVGLAVTALSSPGDAVGIGGGARGDAHETWSGVAFCMLSIACACTQALSCAFMPASVIVRGVAVEASWSRCAWLPTVSHDRE